MMNAQRAKKSGCCTGSGTTTRAIDSEIINGVGSTAKAQDQNRQMIHAPPMSAYAAPMTCAAPMSCYAAPMMVPTHAAPTYQYAAPATFYAGKGKGKGNRKAKGRSTSPRGKGTRGAYLDDAPQLRYSIPREFSTDSLASVDPLMKPHPKKLCGALLGICQFDVTNFLKRTFCSCLQGKQTIPYSHYGQPQRSAGLGVPSRSAGLAYPRVQNPRVI